MRALRQLDRWMREAIYEEGSTRAVAILRVLLGLEAWAGLARGYSLQATYQSPVRIAMGLLFFLSSTCVVSGWKSRLSSFVTGAIILLEVFVWKNFDDGSNFIYALGSFLVLLSLTPCGKSFSLDRLLSPPDRSKEERGPLWGVRLIALQTSAIYFWTAYDKLSVAFLSGARLEQIAMDSYTGSDYPDFPGFFWIVRIVAPLVPLTELFLAFALWVPRLRRKAILVGALFHGIIYFFLAPDVFSVMMMTVYLAFVPSETVTSWTDRLVQTYRRPDDSGSARLR